jgi:hypothetical protein
MVPWSAGGQWEVTMRLLYIVWRDAISNHVGWASLKEVEAQTLPVAHSVGWEIKRDDEMVTLVSSLIGDECSGDVSIPLGWIVREHELKVPSGKTRKRKAKDAGAPGAERT